MKDRFEVRTSSYRLEKQRVEHLCSLCVDISQRVPLGAHLQFTLFMNKHPAYAVDGSARCIVGSWRTVMKCVRRVPEVHVPLSTFLLITNRVRPHVRVRMRTCLKARLHKPEIAQPRAKRLSRLASYRLSLLHSWIGSAPLRSPDIISLRDRDLDRGVSETKFTSCDSTSS